MRLGAIVITAQVYLAGTVSATPLDSLVDFLPLHVGNTWTYSYTAKVVDQLPFTVLNDSGTSLLSIVGVAADQDTASWTVRERKVIRRHFSNPAIPSDTSYSIVDSTTFTLIEVLSDRHRIYRTDSETPIWTSVVPWFQDLSDTTCIFRYAAANDSGIVRLGTHSSSPYPRYVYTVSFQNGVGVIGGSTFTGPYITGLLESVNYTLTGEAITSSVRGDGSDLPEGVRLLQNYPNPFNPTTTIRYTIPRRSHITLAIYNPLGQLISMLLNGDEGPGEHAVTIDGTGLASGVYFCRLQAGSVVQTRSMVLIR